MRRLHGLMLVSALVLLLAACARESVVLLPQENGGPSAVVVLPHGGDAVVLYEPGMAVDVSGGEISQEYALSGEQVEKRYGETLRALPDPPERFLLYFNTGTAELLPESEALLPEVLAAIERRSSTDVSVVGHADRVGDQHLNTVLSTRRALQVSAQLVQMGVSRDILEITSHGEANPLVPTPDGVAEPRNRRVEVVVR